MQIINVGYLSTNYYLLQSSKAGLLVDAGWPGTIKQFKHVLHKNGLTVQNINYVFVTHYHPDHAGIVEELKDEGVILLVAEKQLPYLPLLKNYIKQQTPYKQITGSNTIILSPDNSAAFFKSIGINGDLVYTPGHSDDSFTLLFDTGEAFIGDLARVYQEEDLTTKSSWDILKKMAAKTIYPGHAGKFEL